VSRDEKLKKRLLSRPRDSSFDELQRLLAVLGYRESQSGKTSGSRVAFIHGATAHVLRLHKPHPRNELKQYQIDQLIDELRTRGLL